jgi:hypothetical protein
MSDKEELPSLRELSFVSNGSVDGETGDFDVKWRDGLYSIEYNCTGAEGESCGGALAILRKGVILGSDKFGGVFEGRLASRGDGERALLLLRLRVPPGGRLMTGHQVGAEETEFDLSGFLEDKGPEVIGTCVLEGVRLELRFRFIGDLPHPPVT